ncbi:type II toxin-antitoxin system ParD family antitoxin [Ghiorsea bivora]|uniref:type II toxin-antitoxin system ParD family antitoxin n=1 Tax=Ghiorsea bivora TaxID=1485545 RepID=UPI000570444C|nr:type II toxin-antitoxin system ParD family antitoxin [Ghiorsea bivora]
MNVSLTPSLEQYVRDCASTDDYNNASEVVREAIRLHKQREEYRQMKLARLKEALQSGIDDMENGNFADYSLDSFIDELDNKAKV